MRMQTWPWGDEGEHSDDSDASETGDRRRSHFTAGESALGAGASSLANVDSMEIEPGSCLWRTVDARLGTWLCGVGQIVSTQVALDQRSFFLT